MFIQRDIPNCEPKKHTPPFPENWWKVYHVRVHSFCGFHIHCLTFLQKLKRQADAVAAESTAALKARLDEKAAEKGNNQLTFDSTLRIPKRSRPPTSGNDSRTLGNRYSKHSILSKARREAREASHNHSLLFPPLSSAARESSFVGHYSPFLGPNSVASASPTPLSEGNGGVISLTSNSREDAARRRDRALAQHRHPRPLSMPLVSKRMKR